MKRAKRMPLPSMEEKWRAQWQGWNLVELQTIRSSPARVLLQSCVVLGAKR